MKADIAERCRVAMRTAIRQDKRSKPWAEVNCEDNFCLAVHSIAEAAAMDEVVRTIDDRETIDWFNEQCGTQSQLRAFVLTTSREMYRLLRQ